MTLFWTTPYPESMCCTYDLVALFRTSCLTSGSSHALPVARTKPTTYFLTSRCVSSLWWGFTSIFFLIPFLWDNIWSVLYVYKWYICKALLTTDISRIPSLIYKLLVTGYCLLGVLCIFFLRGLSFKHVPYNVCNRTWGNIWCYFLNLYVTVEMTTKH